MRRVWLFAGNMLILLAFCVAIRSVSDMQIATDDAPVPAEVHRAVVAKLEALTIAFEKLQLQFQTLLRQRFASSSENIKQIPLFGSMDVEVIEQDKVSTPAPPAKKVVARERVLLPKDLPVIREVIDVPEADKLAADGTPKTQIGEEITVKLGYRPAAFFKREIVRPKYADPAVPEAGVTIAALPPQLLDGSFLDATLGAHLLVSKYGDHLPLYRLEDIYARGGVALSRSTLCDWVIVLTDRWLRPLAQALKVQLLQQNVIHVDETPLPLQRDGRVVKARQWTYTSRDPKITLYEFTEDKEGVHVREFLQGWRGYLQADAASNYDALYRTRPEVVEVGCWAHARRKFFDVAAAADKNAKPGEKPQRILAHDALEMIGELFAIERAATEAGDDHKQRRARRRSQAQPVLDKIKAWCEDKLADVLPKSPTAGALSYLLKRWDVFTRYLEDGRIAIDNNAAERALRPVTIGRKNWLFAGSNRGGDACAIAMSLIATAKAHGHDPLAYLTDVLARLPTLKAKDIDSLLPTNWKPQTNMPHPPA